jgi:hypothetical protein
MHSDAHTYLGDGVLVKLDADGSVILITWDGSRETNRIVLEPEVLEELREWVEKTRKG